MEPGDGVGMLRGTLESGNLNKFKEQWGDMVGLKSEEWHTQIFTLVKVTVDAE